MIPSDTCSGVLDESVDDRIALFGVPVLNVSMSQALSRIDHAARTKRGARMLFVNAYSLNVACTDREFRSALNEADAVFGDGVGVRIASKVAGTPIVENVNGTDMFPKLCRLCEDRDYSIFFLGAKPGVIERMRSKLVREYPGLRIAGYHHGYFDKADDNHKIVELVNKSGADIVLVAFGVPEQEKWIMRHATALECSVCIGVGGLFDFFSGDVPRAPQWMRKHGLEWLFRLSCEPKRLWQRYLLGNPLFLWRVLESRLTHRL